MDVVEMRGELLEGTSDMFGKKGKKKEDEEEEDKEDEGDKEMDKVEEMGGELLEGIGNFLVRKLMRYNMPSFVNIKIYLGT